MKNWKTSSLFVHIDTGEIIIFDKIYFEIIKTIKDYDNKKKLLGLQTSSEKQDNSTSENLFKVHVLDDAPFSIIEKDDEFKIVLGNAIVSSKVFDSLESAKSYLDGYCWDVIFSLVYSLIKNFNKVKEYENS